MEGATEGTRQHATAEAAADAILDSLRQLLCTLGSVLASPAGIKCSQDAKEARSLPALGKALKKLWFETPMTVEWDTKEQALWLCRVLAVTEGSRSGILSLYGGGLLLSDALGVFAEVSLAELDIPLDEAWVSEALAVQQILRDHWEQFQQWPSDRRGGAGSDPLVSTDRLPRSLKRALDLEGVRLSKSQAAGLGVAFFMPGSMTLALGGVGAALLIKKAKEQFTQAEGGDTQWQTLQTQWLKHAHVLLRRKTCPIEVRFVCGEQDPQKIKVSLYSVGDPLCALPVGSLGSWGGSSTGGASVARLGPGERCALRPISDDDSFRLRVYRPCPILDIVLHDGVEARRGDRLVVTFSPDGQARVCAEGSSFAQGH